MKKIIAVIAVLLIGGAAYAQPSKGDIILKGRIGFNVVGTTPYKEAGGMFAGFSASGSINLFTINPQMEFLISDKMSVGFSALYMSGWTGMKYSIGDESQKDRSGISVYYIGPTFNRYFRLSERFYFSLECFLGYAGGSLWNSSKYSDGTVRDRIGANFGLLTVTPVLNYYINSRWILTASAGNLAAAFGNIDGSTTSTYYAGVNWGNVMLGVGFSF